MSSINWRFWQLKQQFWPGFLSIAKNERLLDLVMTPKGCYNSPFFYLLQKLNLYGADLWQHKIGQHDFMTFLIQWIKDIWTFNPKILVWLVNLMKKCLWRWFHFEFFWIFTKQIHNFIWFTWILFSFTFIVIKTSIRIYFGIVQSLK